MPSWPPFWSSDSSKSKDILKEAAKKADNALQHIPRNADDLVASLDARASALPPHLLILTAFLLGATTALGGNYIYLRHWRRIPNGEWITPDMLARKRWIKGYVTNVGDADNFRVYHTPGLGWRWPLKFRRIPVGRTDLKDQTIHIRIAGVDAPEGGHFGRPSQPFAEESLAWLKSQVEGKFVYCQLIRKDQFGRIVSAVHLKPRILPGWLATGKDVSVEMLRAGWGSVYEQTGAEYGRSGLAEFMRLQSEAQWVFSALVYRRAKKGMWKHGTKGETPAEYKKRYREAAASLDPATAGAQKDAAARLAQDASGGGLFSRLAQLFSKR
ncbi:SNase-domain-containing protein [Trametes elegans]|nr:SNase-domain-containing protein [Trametes elegans]